MKFRIWIDNNWRAILSRAPLPMLALAASWGVYSFAALYVPMAVAIIQAAAFELTYIGLAITRGLTDEQRKHATAISVGAVVVSVLYNSIDGFFVRNPTWLTSLPWEAEAIGAVLHGAPLAIVAYLVADLLLHSGTVGSAAHEDDSYIGAQPGFQPARVPDQVLYPAPVLSVRPSALESAAISTDRALTATDGRTDQRTKVNKDAVLVSAKTTRAYSCGTCGAALTLGQYGASKRHGHCGNCKSSV